MESRIPKKSNREIIIVDFLLSQPQVTRKIPLICKDPLLVPVFGKIMFDIHESPSAKIMKQDVRVLSKLQIITILDFSDEFLD